MLLLLTALFLFVYADIRMLTVLSFFLHPQASYASATNTTFVLEDDSFGSGAELVELKVLRNTRTGEKVEVVPALGGKTEALLLRTPRGDLREVLLDHHRDAAAVHANVGWKGAMLVPYANRIANGTYKLNGVTHYLERNEDRGAFGKIALHGYLCTPGLRLKTTGPAELVRIPAAHALSPRLATDRKSMVVLAASGGDDNATLTLGYDFDGTDPGYPFLLSVNITYTLHAGRFDVTTTVRNTMTKSGEPLPFFNGWHSYFKVADISKTTLTLDNCSRWNHIRVPNGAARRRDDLAPRRPADPSSFPWRPPPMSPPPHSASRRLQCELVPHPDRPHRALDRLRR